MAEALKDGSRRFTLKGGPLNGIKVRLYPDNPAEVRAGKTGRFSFEQTLAVGTTVTYTHRNASAKTLDFEQEYI